MILYERGKRKKVQIQKRTNFYKIFKLKFDFKKNCSNIIWHFLASEQTKHRRWHCLHMYLTDRCRKHLDDLLVRHSYDTLRINFNDPMAHTYTATFRYTTT